MKPGPAEVLAAVKRIFPRLQAFRRQLHQYPELGFQEHRTSRLVEKILAANGWAITTRIARTGVMGLWQGRARGRNLALRADMDALPITEKNRVAYSSRVPGRMHACGHDGNVAMLLGVALLWPQLARHAAGSLKLLFQPSEETPPGGAKAMIAAGVLKSPACEAVLAPHLDSTLAVGRISLKPGPVMAAADKFQLKVIGQGGHGALPHKSVDAIAVAGEVITNLQHILAREVDPLEPAVVTLGQVAGGSAYNVIADQVQLQGTLRSLNPGLRKKLAQRVLEISRAVCQAHKARCEMILEPGHPALINHPAMTIRVATAGRKLLGAKGVQPQARALMSGEDFTYFARALPACYFWVGGRPAGKAYPWHHPLFNFGEKGMIFGTAVLIQAALDFLEN